MLAVLGAKAKVRNQNLFQTIGKTDETVWGH